jgi:glycosyltransferase involved in cell wall biosynthesis
VKIGFLGYEYFGEKKNNIPSSTHGGFGYLTRQKAEYLAKIGHEVHVFIPAASYDRSQNFDRDMEINGVHIHLYKSADKFSEGRITSMLAKFSQHWKSNSHLDKLLSTYPMDVYQSEEPGLFTLQAIKKSRKHVVVFQDPYDENDFRLMDKAEKEYLSIIGNQNSVENAESRQSIFIKGLQRRSRSYVPKIINRIDQRNIYSEANFISEKVKRMYTLDFTPRVLRNPIDIPSYEIHKADKPTVAWIGRFDPQKRPDIALDAASQLEDIEFHFVGKASEYGPYLEVENTLVKRYSKYTNIHFHGFISESEKADLLRASWIFLNTSAREGLLVVFLEAMANKCALVSFVDPDNYASNFGAVATKSNLKQVLLDSINSELHKTVGENASIYIREKHETKKVMAEQVSIFSRVIENEK